MADVYVKGTNMKSRNPWHVMKNAAFTICGLYILSGWKATEHLPEGARVCRRCRKW